MLSMITTKGVKRVICYLLPLSGTLGRANSAQPWRQLKLGYTSLQRNKIVLPSKQCSIPGNKESYSNKRSQDSNLLLGSVLKQCSTVEGA